MNQRQNADRGHVCGMRRTRVISAVHTPGKGGYRRLEQRLGGNVRPVQSGWRAVGGRADATGSTDRHAKARARGGGGGQHILNTPIIGRR